uniref:protein mono-ADP-ribosyltransferase TIPARP-like n=1 Tax=Scatophagus argus TaxID=75038 RepID=UPI001ED828BF|nr:protein mono-ADP-ribosyltransferase TIPARP-like [Scatophagus argus]XP_046235742.1 protein mono-ADP-ribosyltransferase TIPARP-like [Scatophagus argus]XP_046235743.1 protein mono-ADP-ribosyltransferase TIPARP-like [Scatophagus argus]
MLNASSSQGRRRKMEDNVSVSEPPPKSSRVTLLGPSVLLLEIPTDTNTSLPVWEAMRSQQLNIAWTVNPYGISVHLTPVASKQVKTTASSKSQGTTRVVQISGPSSGILQPQAIIQFDAQQHSVALNSSYVQVTFPQSSSQSLPSPNQPQKILLRPAQATSLIVSLPVIITQSQLADQPHAPTKSVTLSAIQTPTTASTKLQAPSKVPVPTSFHTNTSPDIQICDRFLLGLCRAGKKCKKHHTPYPFHWQLRCVTSRQWIDFPLRSQVLLERMYSNVNQTTICIKDGHDRYTLNFALMELDDTSKYDRVRRLTNSDNMFKNPHFPSQWKIYWRNNLSWEEYDKNVSTLLLMKMSRKEPECSFHIGSREYKVDFSTMTQTNVTTGFQRHVRCRPVYRSPDSMQPYLRTGIWTEPPGPVGVPPATNFSVDPLEDFRSWYPPVWCLASEQDYSLVDVPAETRAYKTVRSFFYNSLPETEVDIISIQQVQNLLHWDKYQRHKTHMQKQHTESKEPLERHLFHGTNRKASEDICHNNFDPRMAGVNGTTYGFGTYFATKASLSHAYSAKVKSDELRHMFLAKVLVGKVSLGMNTYRRPPPLSTRTKEYRLYDTCVDRLDKPTMFVVFDSCQCYPYYLIKYKDLPEETEI